MTTSRPDSEQDTREDGSQLAVEFARAMGGAVRTVLLIEPSIMPVDVPSATLRLGGLEGESGTTEDATRQIVHWEHGCSVLAAPVFDWVPLVRLAAQVEQLEVVIVAAGAPTSDRSPRVVVVSDHLNVSGHNPLVGPNRGDLGTRFPDMSEPYHTGLRHRLRSVGDSGVVASVPRPFAQSDAEVCAALGASALTNGVAEAVIAAVHAGLPIAAVISVDLPAKATSELEVDVEHSSTGARASLWSLVTEVADLVCRQSA